MRVLWLACLLASLAPPAQAGGKKYDLITIGDSRLSKGTFNGNDEAPFLAALAALHPTYGGQIEVLPGRYRFDAGVPIDRSGVTIRGSRGAIIDGLSIPGGESAFHVTGHGVVLDGLRFVAAHPGQSGSFLRVEGNDFTLTHCRFDVLGLKAAKSGEHLAGGYRLVHALPGTKTGGAIRQGTLLDGNSFAFGPDSGGVVGFESEYGSSVRISHNEFIGAEGFEGMVPIGTAVLLRNSEWVTVSGNTFLRLAAPSKFEQDENAILASINSEEAEGHHISITGNYFEVLEGRAVINLAGGAYNVVSGNVFGRTFSPEGCVRLKSAPSSAASSWGSGNVITGNQFHHHSGGFALAHPAIVVGHQEQISITSNQFTDCTGPQVIIGSATSPTYGAFVTGNQFHSRACGGNPPISEAIQFLSGSAHFAGSNVVLKGSGQQSGCGWMAVYTSSGSVAVMDGSGNAILP